MDLLRILRRLSRSQLSASGQGTALNGALSWTVKRAVNAGQDYDLTGIQGGTCISSDWAPMSLARIRRHSCSIALPASTYGLPRIAFPRQCPPTDSPPETLFSLESSFQLLADPVFGLLCLLFPRFLTSLLLHTVHLVVPLPWNASSLIPSQHCPLAACLKPPLPLPFDSVSVDTPTSAGLLGGWNIFRILRIRECKYFRKSNCPTGSHPWLRRAGSL